jgi:ABC-type phosphate transport system substrate-binding protein
MAMKPLPVIVTVAIISLAFLVGCKAGGNQCAINVYTRSDACGASQTWAEYLGNYSQEDLNGTAVYGDPGLAEAVKQDPLGIGYNNLNYAFDMNTGEVVSGLRVIPIDINENGRLDADENFYENKAELMDAIGTGRYPSPPARDLSLVTKQEFTGLSKEFVRWILTDGQQYVEEVGYIPLPKEKIQNGLSKLGSSQPGIEMKGTITISGAWALYPMVIRWAEEFKKIYPDANFDISAGGAGKGVADALGAMVDLGMVSRGIYQAEIDKGIAWVAVTKDAVVPMANEKNPLLNEILAKGVTRGTFADIWITGNITDWREVIAK